MEIVLEWEMEREMNGAKEYEDVAVARDEVAEEGLSRRAMELGEVAD